MVKFFEDPAQHSDSYKLCNEDIALFILHFQSSNHLWVIIRMSPFSFFGASGSIFHIYFIFL